MLAVPPGHQQREHETSHGSMTQTRWAVDGPDGTTLELGGRKYSSNDEGAPMMCNLVCSSLGRHVHVDYCRAGVDGTCDDAEVQHLNGRIFPNPDRAKDGITHGLSWRRMGAPCLAFVLPSPLTLLSGFRGYFYSFPPLEYLPRPVPRSIYSRRTDELCKMVCLNLHPRRRC